MNELTYPTAKAVWYKKICGIKKKHKNRNSHKQPAWQCKIQKEIEAFRGELSILKDLSKGINVKTMKGWITIYKNENDATTTIERIKQNTGQGTKSQKI